MDKLKLITSTTRKGRKGIAFANWMQEFATKEGSFDIELLDLAEINLPLLDEPNHPMQGQYEHEYTKEWSRKIHEADAFIFVLGEYNYGYPAPIKNAIDYLHHEWKYKPVGFLSYGGISAGLRSTQMMKQVVTTLSMMPIPKQVNLPFGFKKVDEHGIFHPDEQIENAALTMLQELKKWSHAMKVLRNDTTTNSRE